ncbi:MAG: Gfo/Idh/MocA family oxidoreductase [Phycisphaerae bacterium]|nr:Gfo/Idh/MocA family oxidoreductase [Phycisphaerae bacterium]
MSTEHIKAFGDIEGVTLAGITSRTRSKAENLAGEYKLAGVYDSIAELYENTQADLVVVSVPELSTCDVIQQAGQFPWAMLLEKPVGYDLADANVIAEALATHKAAVMVALNRRSYSSTQTVLDDLNEIDGPRFIWVQDQQSQALALRIGQPEKVVENWMYANSIHLVDYITLLGRGEITAVTPIVPWAAGKSGTVVAKVEFSSGDVAIYEGIWNGPGPWAITVNVPGKRWELRPLEKAAYQLPDERVLHEVEPHEWDVQFKAGLRFQAQQAVLAAMGGSCELPDIQESMVSMNLVAKIFGLA